MPQARIFHDLGFSFISRDLFRALFIARSVARVVSLPEQPIIGPFGVRLVLDVLASDMDVFIVAFASFLFPTSFIHSSELEVVRLF